MSVIDYAQKANEIALQIISNAANGEALSDALLAVLREAEAEKKNINSIWASIAVSNNWKDVKAGIKEGGDMPKTLANYRSKSRKAMALDVGHQFETLAEWNDAINSAKRLQLPEEKEKIEAINLNDLELPSWIERANSIRTGMTEENMRAFDKYIHHHIEAFLQKKGK